VQSGVALRKDGKYQALVGRLGNNGAWLVLPQSFMNASGRAVQMLAGFFKIQPAEILVVHDECPHQVRARLLDGLQLLAQLGCVLAGLQPHLDELRPHIRSPLDRAGRPASRRRTPRMIIPQRCRLKPASVTRTRQGWPQAGREHQIRRKLACPMNIQRRLQNLMAIALGRNRHDLPADQLDALVFKKDAGRDHLRWPRRARQDSCKLRESPGRWLSVRPARSV